MNVIKTFLLSAGIFSVAAVAKLNEYSIPVSPQLKPWANFIIKEAHLRIRKGRAQLEYPLPSELSGDPIIIQGEGKFYSFDEPVELTGKFLKSCVCNLQGSLARCELKYAPELPALSADGRAATEVYLRETVLDPGELVRRLEVLNEFIDGPAESVLDGHEAGGVFERLKVRYR